MSRTVKYRAGQRVETFDTNFDIPGFPNEWMPGTVDRVNSIGNKGHMDVFVKRDRGGWSPQIVGPRGGNKRIRPLSAVETEIAIK
jgi:hypothetical protein